MRNLIGKALAPLPILAAALLIFHASAQTALAPPIPEIDPGSASNAVALVFGAMALLVGAGRRRRDQSASQ